MDTPYTKNKKPALSISLDEALRKRRSIRHFTAEPVPMEILKTALSAACLAPSPHGTGPWRFCILDSKEAKETLAAEMGKDFLRDMKAEGVPEEERTRRHQGSIRLLTGAPALIMASLSFADLDVYEEPEKQANEWMMAEHSLGGALQNLMLALAVHGVGSVWRCAPLFCPETARKALDLPADWVPRALIVAGYPAQQPAPKETPEPVLIVR
ncbi:MAG: nitroreductase family protein [Nitrospinae bacterium]|nr:nitroreductase family protein [Nitrospinota bacterium]